MSKLGEQFNKLTDSIILQSGEVREQRRIEERN